MIRYLHIDIYDIYQLIRYLNVDIFLLLNPVPASARRFLRFIHCFSSRQLRRHGRQRAPPQQQSSSSRRPLWRRRRPCVDSAGRFGGSATVRRLAAGGCQSPAAASARRHSRRPAADSAPSRRRSSVDDQTCVAHAATGRQPASPGGSCTSELCQYRISFLTLALRDKLCNDSYDHSLIISYNLKEGMRRERYLLDMLQGSKCRNISCATLPLRDELCIESATVRMIIC